MHLFDDVTVTVTVDWCLLCLALLANSVLHSVKQPCGSCDTVWDFKTAAGTSDSAMIRVESSQGRRYSSRGYANTAHRDRTISF